MSEEIARCELCGEPMPPGEEMFHYHGFSGPCPKPPLKKHGEAMASEQEKIVYRGLRGPMPVENFAVSMSDCAAHGPDGDGWDTAQAESLTREHEKRIRAAERKRVLEKVTVAYLELEIAETSSMCKPHLRKDAVIKMLNQLADTGDGGEGKG